MLHEMVTGRKAFEGKSQVNLIAAIVDHDPPPMSSLQPVSPPLLDHLVKTCLAKNPDKRWQTMADVFIQLKLIAESGGELASPVLTSRMKRRLRIAWSAAAVVFVASVALAGAWMFSGSPSEPAKISFEIPTPSAPSSLQNAMSPLGTHVTAIVTSDKGNVLWVRALEHLNANTIPGSEGASFPFWSPDGRFIGFFANGKLKKVDLLGGPPQTLCDATDNFGGTWNADDVIVFAASPGPLFRVSAAGGVFTPLTELDKARQEIVHRHPYFLPDGKHFLYVAISSKNENSGIYVGSLDSKERQFLLRTIQKAIFAPPGYLLFMRESTLMAQRFDPNRLELSGDPFRVAEGVGTNPGNSAAGFTVSNNGVLAFSAGSGGRASYLKWVNRSGGDAGTAGMPSAYESPVVSPDLQRVAVSIAEGTNRDIWILDLTRGTKTRFTFDPGIDNAPLWSPDGSRLVFQSNRTSLFDLYQKSSSGVGQEEMLWKSDHSKTPDDWSSDGRLLLYRDDDPQTGTDLWVLPMTGDKKPQPVARSPFREVQGRLSPDVRWVAYVSNESGLDEVYVQGFPTANNRIQISTKGGFMPRWRRDGKELFFVSPERDVMAVDMTVSGDGILKAGVPHKLFTANPIGLIGRRNTWEVTPDGQRFLIHTNQQETTSVVPLTVVVNWLAGEKPSR